MHVIHISYSGWRLHFLFFGPLLADALTYLR